MYALEAVEFYSFQSEFYRENIMFMQDTNYSS